MNPAHWLFDKLYPLIRFVHEKVRGHAWFSQITPQLWVGGAPTYPRDFAFIKLAGIDAVVDVRAERQGDLNFMKRQNIDYLRLEVLDVMVPPEEEIDRGAAFIDSHVRAGDIVLVHCAKGRGRSATVAAAYLMKYRQMTYEEARELLVVKRPLTNLQHRHRRALEAWMNDQKERVEPPAAN